MPKKSDSKKDSKRLADLINSIHEKRNNLSRNSINLASSLVNIHNKPINRTVKTNSYSRSVSSTFSSTMRNGKVHSVGKEVINDSRQPFIHIREAHNNQLEDYVIPRSNIKKIQSRKSKQTKSLTKKTKKN